MLVVVVFSMVSVLLNISWVCGVVCLLWCLFVGFGMLSWVSCSSGGFVLLVCGVSYVGV